MSYDSWKEQSMHNPHPGKQQPSCCINACIQLHNSLLRPAAHCRDFENCLWYVLVIKANELDKAWCESQALNIKNWWMDFYAVNCRPTLMKSDGPSSFLVQMTCRLVAQKLIGLEAFGCKWLYIETIYWLSIMTLCILQTIVEHPMNDSMALRCVSTEFQRFIVLPIQQVKGCIVAPIQRGSISHHDRWKGKQNAPRPILEMSVNRASTIIGLASWIITGLCTGIDT